MYKDPEEALHKLSGVLSDVAHRWIHVGVFLGVRYASLQTLPRGPPEQKMRDTLQRWLNSNNDVKLDRLVEAVGHDAGGRSPEVANKLRQMLHQTTSSMVH